MFKKIGGLAAYWHVIGFSDELNKEKSVRKTIYDVPILLWRDAAQKMFAVADVCSHKRSPLAISDFDKNEITCPYHGWKYNQKGKLIEIPSSPHIDIDKLKCSLQSYPIREQNGFIWIFLDANKLPQNEPISLSNFDDKAWGKIHFQDSFETNEELLIENFMDATHTAYIHEGIIRGFGEKVKHQITLNVNEKGVSVTFAETTEKVALGLGFLLGKNLRIKHTDAFLPPNLVKVDYYINDIHRFNAFIACTPIAEGKTQAFVRLSFNFKWLNPFIKLILPFLAKKVIRQDQDITRKQYQNQQVFRQQQDNCIDCDLIHNKMSLLRKSIINSTTINATESEISVYL
jgi:phenylpropionate dioxygenase-like ring-hydroxylating dioxygenase large terminal subunit